MIDFFFLSLSWEAISGEIVIRFSVRFLELEGYTMVNMENYLIKVFCAGSCCNLVS